MATSTRTWGASRKAGALIGLVLALAVLNPASALAEAGGTDRPIKGAGMGTISVHPATGAFTGVVPGVSSHLGNVTVHIEGVGAPAAGRHLRRQRHGDDRRGERGRGDRDHHGDPDGPPRRSHDDDGGRHDHRRHGTVRGRERDAHGDLRVGPPVPGRGDAGHRGRLHVHGTDQLLAGPSVGQQRPRRSGPLRCPLRDAGCSVAPRSSTPDRRARSRDRPIFSSHPLGRRRGSGAAGRRLARPARTSAHRLRAARPRIRGAPRAL